MFLMYYEVEGKRVYTFAKTDPNGNPTKSAHPARFSPQDQFSKQRILLKQRFGILPAKAKTH